MRWSCEAYKGCPCPECVSDEDVAETLTLWIKRAESLDIHVHCGGCEGHCDNSAEISRKGK